MKRLGQKVRAWTTRRQHLGGAGTTSVSAALADVVGVYGSHPSGPLSLLARCPEMEAADFRALDADRLALRIPAMRLSVHLIPTAIADEVFAGTRTNLRTHLWRLGPVGLNLDGYRTMRNEILEITRTPASAGRIRATLGLSGPQATAVIQTMTFEGVLLRVAAGSLRDNILKYVASDAWLGRELGHIDEDAGRAALAGRYLHAFGPARLEDLAWWSGRPKTQMAAALHSLDLMDLGDGLLLPAADEDAFAAVEPIPDDQFDILPVWDPYVMGHAPDGHGRFAATKHLDRLYDDVGNGLGVILIGGKAAAAWGSHMDGFRLRVAIDRFHRLSEEATGIIEDRFQRIAGLLDADGIVIDEADGPLRPMGDKRQE